MGSRVREKPEHLFEVFVEIAKPNGKSEEPFIIQRYPPDFDDKETLMMIPKFAYPCPTDSTPSSVKSNVDHFTFVLTDLESMFRFGHCRHATGHQTCLCFVSWLPWYEIFYKMLDLLAEIINRSEKNHVTNFLRAAYSHEVPSPRISVTIVANGDMFNFVAPDKSILPSIPGSRNLTEYYNAVDPYNMMVIFASMLHERRIYMISKKLSRLTACIHAAEALLYPMHWQHLYIPVLPAHLIEYISAPMPYLIGVHSNLVEKLKQNRVDVGDAVVVDLDTNAVTTEYDDLGDLPEDVSSYLKRNLKMDVVKNSMMKAGDVISMAFLHALVRLIGGYRDALKFRPGEPITFDPEAFVHSRPSQSTQAFLEGMLTLQIFQQFIYGRLEILNAGVGFIDIFEQQATLYADKLNSQSKYKEWLKSVKKSGKKGWNGLKGKLLWSIKVFPSSQLSLAAPMVSTAVHTVREQGKRAMADFKTKFSGLTENENKSGSNHQLSKGVAQPKPVKTRPVTSHSGNIRTKRPARPPPPTRATQSEYEKRNKPALCVQYTVDRTDEAQVQLSYQRVDMNLMTDSDIQAAMQKSTSSDIFTGQREQSSSDSDSSGSEEAFDGTNISFDILHSSDEDMELNGPGRATVGRPVAAPRRSTSTSLNRPNLPQSPFKGEHSDTPSKDAAVQNAPLIEFDSSESPTDSESFDLLPKSPPESPGTPSETSFEKNESVGDRNARDERSLQRNGNYRVSLTRSKAFRREAPAVPVRTHYADDFDDLDGPDRDLTVEMFDPLSGLTLSNSVRESMTVTKRDTTATHFGHRDPLSSHSPRRDNSELLMHEWSLATLAKGPSIKMPITAQSLRISYPERPVSVGKSQDTSLVRQSVPIYTFSTHHVGRGATSNQGHIPTNSDQFHHKELSLDKKVTDTSQSNRKEPQKFLPVSNSSSPARSYLPAGSSSRPQSSMSPRTPGMMNFTAPIPSSSAPSVHKSTKHAQRVISGVVSSKESGSSSSSGSYPLKRSDFFSDLRDIEFSPGIPPDQPDMSQELDTYDRPVQPKWETFD